MALYVDTSAFYAWMVAADRFHVDVAPVLRQRVTDGEALFSSSYALSETLGLLQIRHGREAADRFMALVYPAVEWIWMDDARTRRAWDLVMARGGRGFTVVDASAVVCIGERPGSACCAVDEGLRGFGFDVVP